MTERQNADGAREKDRPWLMRTYAGHSTAEASNAGSLVLCKIFTD